jgi:hypothetical protein
MAKATSNNKYVVIKDKKNEKVLAMSENNQMLST